MSPPQVPLAAAQAPPGGSTGRISRRASGVPNGTTTSTATGPDPSRPSLEDAPASAPGAAPPAAGGSSNGGAGGAGSGSTSLRARLTSGSSLMKVIGAARSITPERLRTKSDAAASRRSSAGGGEEAQAAGAATSRGLRHTPTGDAGSGTRDVDTAAAEAGAGAPQAGGGASSGAGAGAAATAALPRAPGLLPAATELAARLLPLVIALDTGRCVGGDGTLYANLTPPTRALIHLCVQ